MIDAFRALNTELAGLRRFHTAWLRKIRELDWNGKNRIRAAFPLIGDLRMEAADKYGRIQPGQSNAQAVRAADSKAITKRPGSRCDPFPGG